MSSILTKQLTENANSNGNLTLLNWKQFSAKPILTIFNLKTGHLILHMKHPSIVEKKPLKRQLKKLLLKRQQLLPILRPLKAKTI